MSGLLDKMKKIEAGWEGETAEASAVEEKVEQAEATSKVDESLDRINSAARLSGQSEESEKVEVASVTEETPVVEEKAEAEEAPVVEEKKEEKTSEEPKKKKVATKGKSPQNFKVGGKKSTGKKKGSSSKPKGSGIANADKLQAIVDQKKKSTKACPKQSKLHKHLNTVGEDGVSHKDRIEKELEEHAKKVKKIIYISCGSILALLVVVLIIFTVMKNSPKTSSGRGSTTKVKTVAPAYDTFAKEMWAYVKTESFNKDTFHKDFDTFIKQYPADKAKAEKLKARLMRLYNISE